MNYNIDEIRKQKHLGNSVFYFRGWVSTSNYKIILKSRKFEYIYNPNRYRPDLENVVKNYSTKSKYGFHYIKEVPTIKNIKIYIQTKDRKIFIYYGIFNGLIQFFKSINALIKKIIVTLKRLWKQYKFIVPLKIYKKYFYRLKQKIEDIIYIPQAYNPHLESEYNEWLKKEGKKKIQLKEFKYNPLISIAIPVYNVPEEYLRNCLDSIIKQKYTNFEVCLADDCSTKEHVKKVLEEYKKKDSRIKVVYREKNGHISEATNSALSICKGEFVGLVDNDDILNEYALYEVVQALNENKNLDMIYTDEDKMDIEGNRSGPHFKPDYSPDTLLSHNYICHFTVLRKSIIDKIGGFRKGYEGAQDYDLFLRFTEETTPDKIHHISKILYHWRMIPGSTATDISNKDYACIRGMNALSDALNRRDIDAVINNWYTSYIINYKLPRNNKISIIIDTCNINTLPRIIRSVKNQTKYSNYEIIVLYKDNKKSVENILNKFRNIQFCDKKDVNLFIKEKLDSDILLFIKDIVKYENKNWIETMAGYAIQKHIAVVGPKVLYEDDTIKHSGMILGLGNNNVARDGFKFYHRNQGVTAGRLIVPYNYSAISDTCMMIERKKFIEVSGYDEKLENYKDVDLCIKLLNKGYYNVFLPQISVYSNIFEYRDSCKHSEANALMNEADIMKNKYVKELKRDRFYNDNFSYNVGFMLDKGKR